VEVQEIRGRAEIKVAPIHSTTPHQGVSGLGGVSQGGQAA